jgi:hypothetical protein
VRWVASHGYRRLSAKVRFDACVDDDGAGAVASELEPISNLLRFADPMIEAYAALSGSETRQTVVETGVRGKEG